MYSIIIERNEKKNIFQILFYFKKKNISLMSNDTPHGTRTRSLRLRRPMPYHLANGANITNFFLFGHIYCRKQI